MPQLFSAIKKTYLQVKPYNSEKLAYKLIFICLTILNRMVIIYELNNFLTKNREELN